MAEDTQIDRNDDARIYEAAFHVIPSLEEADAAAVAAGIRGAIEAKGGTVLGGDAPQLMRLAYPMQKDIDRKRHTFTSAYFGWVVFEATGDVAHEVKESLGKDDKILRSLVIKTIKEAAEPRKHPARLRDERPVAPMYTPKTEEKPAEPMTVEAMDAEIAKLVVE
jgi:ribosomal protein S6